MRTKIYKSPYRLSAIILVLLFATCNKCELNTAPPSNITANSATIGCNLACNDKSSIKARGVCWGLNSNPTINDSNATDETGTDTFKIVIIGLDCKTKYYARSFFINDKDTYYGNEESFTTLSAALPSVTTDSVTDITFSTAQCGGNVTADGGAIITASGICWNTSPNPTVNNEMNSNTIHGIGEFSGSVMELKQNETYYIRAFASNCKGTAYGNEVSFYHPIPVDYLITIIKNCQSMYVRRSYDDNDCFTWINYNYFHSQLNKIKSEEESDMLFSSLVDEIKKLSQEKRNKLFNKALKTFQKTWAELGKQSPEGQTEAGQKAQKEIAVAIVNLVKQKIK